MLDGGIVKGNAKRLDQTHRPSQIEGLMAIDWDKYGLVAKPGPDGGPYILEPKTWDLVEELFAELKKLDKPDRVVIAVDFKAKKVIDHKSNPNAFLDF